MGAGILTAKQRRAIRAAVWLAPIVLLASGCASPAGDHIRPAEATYGSIVVDDGTGGQMAVNVTQGTGTIFGQVLNDAGSGLPQARVTVWGADQGSTTNRTGWFEVPNVPPGTHQVRAEHESYQAAEGEVLVTAGNATRLTITLLPTNNGDPGSRPHTHDYWAGRTQVTVIDNDFQWYRPQNSGPYAAALPYYGYAAALAQSACVFGAHDEFLSGFPSPFYFSEPTQLVWAGTGIINVTVRWAASDFVGASTVGVVWKPAGVNNYSWSQPLKSGDSLSVSVDPDTWDAGHQTFTLWEFYLCMAGKGEQTTVSGSSFIVGRSFIGKYHVTATMERTYPIFVEPPHPNFWANGSRLPVIDEWRNVTCSSGCVPAATNGRTFQPEFVWKPPATVLVPPGTGILAADLWWSYSLPTATAPLSLSYSAANQPKWDKQDPAKYQAPPPESHAGTHRAYSITVKPGESDQFYQRSSNWVFLWNEEGHEGDANHLQTCGCTLQLHLRVTAIRG